MNKKRSTSSKMNEMPIGIGLGITVSLLITILGVAITAYLTVSEKISVNAVGIATGIILTIAAAAGALAAVLCIKKKRMQICLLTGAIYYLCLLAITALFFGGQYSGVPVNTLCVFCGCSCVALASIKFGNGRNHVKKKYPYR